MALIHKSIPSLRALNGCICKKRNKINVGHLTGIVNKFCHIVFMWRVSAIVSMSREMSIEKSYKHKYFVANIFSCCMRDSICKISWGWFLCCSQFSSVFSVLYHGLFLCFIP